MCVGPIWEVDYICTCLFQIGTTEYRLNEVAICLLSRKSVAKALAMGMSGPFQRWFSWGNQRFFRSAAVSASGLEQWLPRPAGKG